MSNKIETEELDQNKEDKSHYWQAGLNYFNAENYERAIECYEKALELAPKTASLWFNAGINYFKRKNYITACSYFIADLTFNSKQGKSWHNLGRVIELLGSTQESLRCYRKAKKAGRKVNSKQLLDVMLDDYLAEEPSNNIPDPLTVLKLRLAKGEVSLEEYQELKIVLEE